MIQVSTNTSERERNKNLTNYHTQMWIEIGQSEKSPCFRNASDISGFNKVLYRSKAVLLLLI